MQRSTLGWATWFGLVWCSFLSSFGSARFGSVRFGSVRFGSVRFGSVRFGSVRFGLLGWVGLGSGRVGCVRFGWVWVGLGWVGLSWCVYLPGFDDCWQVRNLFRFVRGGFGLIGCGFGCVWFDLPSRIMPPAGRWEGVSCFVSFRGVGLSWFS